MTNDTAAAGFRHHAPEFQYMTRSVELDGYVVAATTVPAPVSIQSTTSTRSATPAQAAFPALTAALLRMENACTGDPTEVRTDCCAHCYRPCSPECPRDAAHVELTIARALWTALEAIGKTRIAAGAGAGVLRVLLEDSIAVANAALAVLAKAGA